MAVINYNEIVKQTQSTKGEFWANIKQVNMSPVEPCHLQPTYNNPKVLTKALEQRDRLKKLQKLSNGLGNIGRHSLPQQRQAVHLLKIIDKA